MARLLASCVAAAFLVLFAGPSAAEVSELRIGKQYGLPYIQFVIMEDQQLVAKHAKLQGLNDLQVTWTTLGGPTALTEGIATGAIDVAAVGLPHLVSLWSKTRKTTRVRAICGMNAMPLVLLTRDPKIKTIEDFAETDRIALPSVKISMQAILLQMAAARTFGSEAWEKLDPLTVSMSHPDAVTALASGGEVTSHFSGTPFQYRQLKQPGYHQVLSSRDIIGPHSVSSIVMTSKFHDENPKTVSALLAAIKEATRIIKADKRAAAETYLRVTGDKMRVEEVVEILNDPNVIITIKPMGAEKIGEFMVKVGRVRAKPDDWRDYYFADPGIFETN